MTCIVGVAHQGAVYIAGDSAGVDGWGSMTIRADQKVFKVGEMVFGFTTSFRMGQALRYNLSVPGRTEKQTDDEYLVTQFIPAVQSCLERAGWLKTECGRKEGGEFLLGYRGRLYRIGGDFQVGSPANGYDAVGSGFAYALGALSALTELDPLSRLTRALEIAAHHQAYVRAPFEIVSVGT